MSCRSKSSGLRNLEAAAFGGLGEFRSAVGRREVPPARRAAGLSLAAAERTAKQAVNGVGLTSLADRDEDARSNAERLHRVVLCKQSKST